MEDFDVVQKGSCDNRGVAFLGHNETDSWFDCHKKATAKGTSSAPKTEKDISKFSIIDDKTDTTVAATKMPWATALAAVGAVACVVGAVVAVVRRRGKWTNYRQHERVA